MDSIGRLGEMLAKNKTIAMIRFDSDTKTGLYHVLYCEDPTDTAWQVLSVAWLTTLALRISLSRTTGSGMRSLSPP